MTEKEQIPPAKLHIADFTQRLETWTSENSPHAHDLALLPEQKREQDIRHVLNQVGSRLQLGDFEVEPENWQQFKTVLYQKLSQVEADYAQRSYQPQDTLDRTSISQLREQVDRVAQLGDVYFAS